MSIERVGLIGIGAMGMLMTAQFIKKIESKNFCVIVDEKRLSAYREKTFYVNGEVLDIPFAKPEDGIETLDLAIFAVKYGGLHQAIATMRPWINHKTTIISLLNGIASEKDLAEAYQEEQILHVVAQGMDATRDGNRMVYTQFGELAIGCLNRENTERLDDLRQFLVDMEIPFVEPEDIQRQIWNKFMFNTGVNQVCGVYGGGYGVVQKEGEARRQMRQAMREVLPLAEKEGIVLTEEDIDYWMSVADQMSPEGKPSMLQDIEAGRKSEVELFSGTVCKLAKKHGQRVPVNEWLYEILVKKNEGL